MKFLYFLVSFFATTLAITFHCQFELLTWNLIGTSYSCVTSPSNINNSQWLTGVTGNHQWGNLNINVTMVFIYECTTLPFIPQGIDTFFPNIVGLAMDNCNVSSITGFELNGYDHLQWISIMNNRIEHIPGHFFSQNPSMQFAHFNNNRISSVGNNFPNSLASFQLAQFWQNICINDGADNASSMPSLIANLQNNCAVPEDTTTQPTTTTTITLSTTSSSTPEPTCDINETICELKIQNQILAQQNAEMKEKLDYLSRKMDTTMELIIELSTRPCGK